MGVSGMMTIVKYLITALVIVIASEVAKRTGKVGALITALPLVTILVMTWMHVEKQSADKIAVYAQYTIWYVIPTLPMFPLMYWLLNKGTNYWLCLLLCAVLTVICFLLTTIVGRRFGIELMP